MTELKASPAGAKPATAARTMGAGGRRLAAAFDSASSLPALADASGRLSLIAASPAVSSSDLINAVEGDAALTIAVMQAANNGNGHRRIPEATVARLPVYVRSLIELADARTATISSERLA